MPPSASRVTRLLGSGRSSEVSQKSSEWLRHEIQRPAGCRGRCAALQCLAVELADEGDVAHRIGPVCAAEIKIVHRKRFLKNGRIGTFRHRHQDGVDVAHVVASDDVRAVGQPVGMLVIGGAEQQSRGIDRAARRDDDVSRNFLATAIALDDHFADLASGWIGFKPFDVRVRQERHVGMFKRRIDGTHLCIGLSADEAGKSVAGLAANAAAGVRVFFVEHDTQRSMKWAQAQTDEVIR